MEFIFLATPTCLMAVAGLLAGWLECVRRADAGYRGLRRITLAGWILGVSITLLALVSTIGVYRRDSAAQRQLDEIRGRLCDANTKMESLNASAIATFNRELQLRIWKVRADASVAVVRMNHARFLAELGAAARSLHGARKAEEMVGKQMQYIPETRPLHEHYYDLSRQAMTKLSDFGKQYAQACEACGIPVPDDLSRVFDAAQSQNALMCASHARLMENGSGFEPDFAVANAELMGYAADMLYTFIRQAVELEHVRRLSALKFESR